MEDKFTEHLNAAKEANKKYPDDPQAWITLIREKVHPKSRTPEENKAYCEKYPFLTWYGDPLYMGYDENHELDYHFTWEDELEPGWRHAFCPQIWDELKEILEKANYVNEFRFTQIKEKFGTLRLHFGGVPEEIWKEIEAWEEKYYKLSEQICFDCGENLATHMSTGWITFICRDCAKKRDEEYFKKYGSHEHFVEIKNMNEFYEDREAYWKKHKDEEI